MPSFSISLPEHTGKTLTGQVIDPVTDIPFNPTPVALTESSGVFTGTTTEALPSYAANIIVREAGVIIAIVTDRLSSPVQPSVASDSDGGYEFTGGFTDRTTGTAGVSDVGSNVSYTQAMVNDDKWMRFGFSSAQQLSNDSAYWTEPSPASTAGVGLFGGSYMPSGVDSLFDFGFNASSYSDEVSLGDLKYTAANGSLDFTQCKAGDLALCRFDFNIVPQVANTTLEVAMIWQTRDSSDNPTFTFALTGEPQFFGTGSVGRTFLARPILSAYFASNEDVNARALFAIRADNPVQIQPLTTLITIQR